MSSDREIIPPALSVSAPPLMVIKSFTSGVVRVAVLPICMARMPPVFRVSPPARVRVAISEARTSPGATTPPLPTVSKPLRV